MRILAVIIVFLVGFAAVRGSASAAGIDRTYVKQNGGHVWGDLLSEFFRFRLFAKSYALVIGIDDYTAGYRSLPTGEDPIRMRDFLLNEAGFDYVHVLTNEKATAKRVRELMIDVFPEMVGARDRFLFYWSGHGDQRQNALGGQIGYLPLANSAPGQFSSMISMGDIRRWDELLSAQQVLFLLDACFSGLAGSASQSEQRELSIGQLMRPSHHLVTAGTGEEETIAGDHWGGSIFTNAVLAAARGAADSAVAGERPDGVVSLYELMDYVQKRVAREKDAAGWSGRITPQMRDLRRSDGQFFFLSNEHKIAEKRDETTPLDATWVFKSGMPYVEESEPDSDTLSTAPSDIDRQVWEAIDGSQDEDKLEVFIETHPNSPWVPFAQRQLERLRDAERVAAPASDSTPEEAPKRTASSEAAGAEPSSGPEALEAALGLSKEQRKNLQWSLYKQGFYNGPIDGVLGEWSREAIASWQRRMELEPSSYLTTRSEFERLLGEGETAETTTAKLGGDRPEAATDSAASADEADAFEVVAIDGPEYRPESPDRSTLEARAETLLARWTPSRYLARDTGWQDCSRPIVLGSFRQSPSTAFVGLADTESSTAFSVQRFSGFDVDAELMAVIEAGRSTVIEYKSLKSVRGWCRQQIYHADYFSQLLRSSGLSFDGGSKPLTGTSAGFVYAIAGRLSDSSGRHCFLFAKIHGKRRIDGYSCHEKEAALKVSEIERFLGRIRL